MKSFRRFLFVRVAVFFITMALQSPQLAHAQASATGEFKFSREVHWGEVLLPAVDSLTCPGVRQCQAGTPPPRRSACLSSLDSGKLPYLATERKP